MNTLRQALEMTPRRLLLRIGRRRGLRFSSNLLKTELVDRLAQTLIEPANLQAALADQDLAARRALHDLQAAGGRLSLRYLQPRHGDLRSGQALDRPAAAGALERLRLSGLAFLDPATADLFIPTDLLPHLPPPPDSVTVPAPTDSTGSALSGPDLLCHDLAVLLALLQRDDVRPLPGGWLPPRFLTTWGQQCAVPPTTPDARSEKQTGRRRFLHYLATQAGWIAPAGPFLKPTPAAWLWLRASHPDRLQTMWDAWAAPDPNLWRAFDLPGSASPALRAGASGLDAPARLLAAVHAGLNEMAASDAASFAQALVRRRPQMYDLAPPAAFGQDALLIHTISQLLTGPLVWLGLASAREKVALSSQALAWLAGNPLSDDDAPHFARFAITSDLKADPLESTFTLTLEEGLPEPAHLAVVVEVGSREYGVVENGQPPTSYSILPTCFIHALHRGWSAPALADALDELAARPLTGQERAVLHSWAALAERVAIRRLTILETTDPDIITRLTSARRGRSLIVRTLSPRAVVVDEGQLDPLVRRLTRQEGVPPRVGLPAGEHTQGHTNLGAGGAAHAWLALRVYQGLGQLIRLPARTPQALLEVLAAVAGPADLAAAETAAEATLEALQEALVGRAPFPAWRESGLPVEASIAIIEEALAQGQAVEMDYYTAGRDVRTHRVVEPFRLERRNDVPYLVGFCHRAQAERVFRLDRIYAVVKVPLPDKS